MSVGGGELLRAVLAEAKPILVLPKWYTLLNTVVSSSPAGTKFQRSFQIDQETFFLWTNTYALSGDFIANNAIQFFPPQSRGTFNIRRSSGVPVSLSNVPYVNVPTSGQSSSAHSEYELLRGGDFLNIEYESLTTGTGYTCHIVFEGLEYRF